MAARSSMIAIDTSVSFKESGTLFPSKVITPKAKAMSVAAGIAHPLMAVASPKFMNV